MRIIETQAYQFTELSEQAKQKALDKAREWQADDNFWHEYVIDDAKEIGKLLGIDIDKIYFSGFSSQGDGACFTGHYEYVKGAAKKIQEYAPKDEELHSIAERLQAIQKRHFYGLSASIKHRGYYYHSGCTDIDVYKNGNYLYSEAEQEAEEEIKDLLREFMDWVYSKLEREYEWLTSDEQVQEMIQANGYEFDEDGNIL